MPRPAPPCTTLTALHRSAPHRTAHTLARIPAHTHRTAPHRTAPHRLDASMHAHMHACTHTRTHTWTQGSSAVVKDDNATSAHTYNSITHSQGLFRSSTSTSSHPQMTLGEDGWDMTTQSNSESLRPQCDVPANMRAMELKRRSTSMSQQNYRAEEGWDVTPRSNCESLAPRWDDPADPLALAMKRRKSPQR